MQEGKPKKVKDYKQKKGLLKTIEDFFDDQIVSTSKKNQIPASKLRSYQDISELLMNMGMDIRRMTDILLELGRSCGIPLKQTTMILNRNQRTHNQHFSNLSDEKILIEDIMKGYLMRRFHQFSTMKFGRGKLDYPSYGYLSFREKAKGVSDRKAFGIFQIMKLILPFLIGKIF
jgi:hypothetical protein